MAGTVCVLVVGLVALTTRRTDLNASASQEVLVLPRTDKALNAPARTIDVAGRSILQGTEDDLRPLPSGVQPRMSVNEVLNALDSSPDAAYVADRSRLNVEAGTYSNPNAIDSDGPISDRIVYVITGGQAACRPAGPLVTTEGDRDPGAGYTCAAVIIADANTGKDLLTQERGDRVEP
ncbi:MAG: hypothetical protein ABIR12_01880 [Ilumatobacteraceae bacterium]